MNSFNDFLACINTVQDQGYSKPRLTCCKGTSAGGLIVAHLCNNQPDKISAAIMKVNDFKISRYVFIASIISKQFSYILIAGTACRYYRNDAWSVLAFDRWRIWRMGQFRLQSRIWLYLFVLSVHKYWATCKYNFNSVLGCSFLFSLID